MITPREAYRIATDFINDEISHDGINIAIIDGETIEKEFWWVFFYNSNDFIKSNDYMDSLIGNAPIIVDRFDRSVHVTGTAFPIEHYIEEYGKRRRTR